MEKLDKLKKILTQEYDKYTKNVRYYENMRRNVDSNFYRRSYQTTIHKYNAKRELLKEVLRMIEEVESDMNEVSDI